MKLDELAIRCGEWLRGSGPQSEIVISSRIRLARNLSEFPFIRRCTDGDRQAIQKTFSDAIASIDDWKGLMFVSLSDLPTLDRQLLVERQLISRELSETAGSRCVFIDPQETFSLMVNEEDHLRMQVMHSGLDMDSGLGADQQDGRPARGAGELRFSRAAGLSHGLPDERRHGHARERDAAFAGPGASRSRSKRCFAACRRWAWRCAACMAKARRRWAIFIRSATRSRWAGARSIWCKQVGEVIPVIIDYERQARAFLVKESRKDLHDRVSRAYGILCTAQTISSEETLHLLSSVRMGVYLGLIPDLEIPTINKLFIHTQPAHLQKLRGTELPSADRNVERAMYLQSHLRKQQENGGAKDN